VRAQAGRSRDWVKFSVFKAKKVLNSVEEAKEKPKNNAADFSGKISLAAPACLYCGSRKCFSAP
jgi:hypothetical protein